MSLPTIIRVNSTTITGLECPDRVIVVYPEPSGVSLTGAPLTSGWPTAYLFWDAAMPATVLSAWAGRAGRATDIVLPDPRASVGTLEFDTVTYYHHAEFTYGYIHPPQGSDGNSLAGATLWDGGTATSALAEWGTVVVRITDLSRFPSWPFP